MGLVKHAVWIVIAVGVLIANSSDLAELNGRVASLIRILLERRCVRIIAWLTWLSWVWLCKVLASEEQHLFVKAAYYGDLRLGLRRRWLLSICCLQRYICLRWLLRSCWLGLTLGLLAHLSCCVSYRRRNTSTWNSLCRLTNTLRHWTRLAKRNRVLKLSAILRLQES